MPGMGELIVILLIVLVVFGASKLPGIGDALGRSIKNFKRASKVEDDEPEEIATKDDKKQLVAPSGKKALGKGADATAGAEEGEWEEVVVRRKKS